MLQNPRKTLGFKKNMVYKIPPGGGGKPYPASGLIYRASPNGEEADEMPQNASSHQGLYQLLSIQNLILNN